jgi:tRNA pseudouridine55 synthase
MQYQDLDKSYEASIRLGSTTPSFDLETAVDNSYPWEHITLPMVEESIEELAGEQEQVPPIFSAKSVDGKRAYEMARKGKTVELRKQIIAIHALDILSFDPPDLKISVDCSKGTYIRSIARDLGQKLGSGAHLTGLRRTRIGPYHVSNATSLENFLEKLQPL